MATTTTATTTSTMMTMALIDDMMTMMMTGSITSTGTSGHRRRWCNGLGRHRRYV